MRKEESGEMALATRSTWILIDQRFDVRQCWRLSILPSQSLVISAYQGRRKCGNENLAWKKWRREAEKNQIVTKSIRAIRNQILAEREEQKKSLEPPLQEFLEPALEDHKISFLASNHATVRGRRREESCWRCLFFGSKHKESKVGDGKFLWDFQLKSLAGQQGIPRLVGDSGLEKKRKEKVEKEEKIVRSVVALIKELLLMEEKFKIRNPFPFHRHHLFSSMNRFLSKTDTDTHLTA